MGGKKKQQSQRTKNNVKPSNSGRTAELLTANIGMLKGLTDTSFSSNLPQLSSTALDFIDPKTDPNFQIVLKKMTKKDGITRHKALTEFVNLCNESNTEALKSALPFWAHVYGNLALDVEHRVREAAQHAHHAIVSQVGRNLAPYIKQIAPQWFISQYDTYAPAASAASNSFKAAFPPHKLVDVIVFCQMEILQYISENILVQSPESIQKTDKKCKDEMEARHERILISSLNGYTLYLSKIPKEHITKAIDIHINIITSSKFWKLSSYKNGAVRAAWFSLLSSFLQFAPHLLEDHHKRVVNTVLGHIDDYDPIVLPTVWEAVLLVVTTVKNCWQHVNVDKFFIPKFCHILEQGGQGNAHFIYPNIILLISNIPESVMKDKVIFFGKIFCSFQKGLKQSSVIQSQSESEAVATALIECIQYLIMIYADEKEFCSTLIERSVIEVISVTMLDSMRHHLRFPLFTSLAQMLLHWKNNETQNVNYKRYTELFWAIFINICKINIIKCLTEKETLSILFDSNQNMFDVLINRRCKKRKNLKVKFSTDSVATDESNLEKTETPSFSVDIHLQSNIIKAAKELLKEYIKIANECDSYDIKLLAIKQLQNVINIFPKEYITQLIDDLETDLCSSFFNWIKDTNIPTESLVGVIFAVVDSIQNKNQVETTLSELTKTRSKDAILEVAKLANHRVNDTLIEWMRSSLVKDELCSLCKKLNEVEDKSVDVLYQCLTNYSTSKGFIIGEETVLSLLSVVIEQLKSRTTSNLKKITAILDSVFSNNNQNSLRNYKEILLELLHLCFQVIICNKSWDTLFTVWQKGLISLGTLLIPNDPLFAEHVSLCANFVADHINESSDTATDNDLSMTIKVSTTFISSLMQQNSENEIGFDISKLFLRSVLNKSIHIHQKQIEDVCFHTELIHGNLLHIENETVEKKNNMIILKEKWDPLKEINLISYIRSLEYCVKYVLYLMGETYSDEDNSEVDVQHILPNFNISKINEIVQICVNLCYGLVLAETLKSYYSDTKQYFAIGDSVKTLKYLLKELIHRLDSEQQSQILSLAQENSKTLGKQWNQTCCVLAVEFLDLEKSISSKLLLENLSLLTNDSTLNIEYLRALKNDMLNNYVQEFELSTFLDNLIKIYKEQPTSSYCVDLSNFKGSHLREDSELARLLAVYIKNNSSEIDKSQNGWDFIMISTCSWLKSISITKTPTYYKEFVEFVVAVSDLYTNFISCLINEKKGTTLFEEWVDVFLKETCNSLGVAWEFIANKTLNCNMNYVGLIHLKKLSEILCKSCQIEDTPMLQINNDNYEAWVFKARKFIISPCVPVQITSYYILLTVVPNLVKFDSNLDENELHKLTSELIKSTFTETQNIVTTMLQDFSLGVSCSVAAFTDSYTYTLGYLLTWSVLLEMCKHGDSQLRYIYTLWIKEMNLIPHIMESLLKLMPDSVLHFLESNVKKRYELFIEKPPLAFDGWESERLSHFCCWLFCDLLRTLPAVARQWSAESDQKLTSYADKITTSYVSSALCAEEMKAIVNQQKAFDNMKISTHPSVREVVAVYTVEESSTELVVTLASNHPLSPPKVEIPKAMISSNQTRQWLMQLTIFLTHQNGSIWDGLLLWKSNLDKKFEGIEECYICFSILHNTSHQLPKLSCQTCKKKFHSFCLYKWFTTSNKSTCPICRNHF